MLFPIFMWVGLEADQRRLTRPVLLIFATALVAVTVLEAHGTWVA